MHALRFPVVTILPLFFCAIGCGSTTVIQRSGPPSALLPVAKIYVVSDLSTFTVEGESESAYVGDLDAEEVEDYEKAKEAMQTSLTENLQEEVPGVQVIAVPPNAVPNEAGAAVLTVKYLDVFPGYYGFGSDDAVVTAQLSFAVGGGVTDVVQIEADSDADRYRPTMMQRLSICGAEIGEEVGEFINESRAP